MPGVGYPFGYFFQDQIEEPGDEGTNCMVTGYEPAQEFVVVLLKPPLMRMLDKQVENPPYTCSHQMPVHSGRMTGSVLMMFSIISSPKKKPVTSFASSTDSNR